MKMRTLGRSDLTVSEMGLGCMGMNSVYGTANDKGEMIALKGVTPAQLALAWVLKQRPWIVPIPGTTKQARLDENIEAVAISLGTDELEAIESLASSARIEGDRYDAAEMTNLNR